MTGKGLKKVQKDRFTGRTAGCTEVLTESGNSACSIGDIFFHLGPEPEKNIRIIVEKTCELFNGLCCLYNRFYEEDNSLYTWAGCRLPEDFPPDDQPDGHICYEETILKKNRVINISDISETEYWKTDPNVVKYGLRSYLGFPVHLQGCAVGALCVVDNRMRKFSLEEEKVITTLAKAVSLEEERMLSDERFRRAVMEKEFLMKEISHRVKNNLTLVISLIKLKMAGMKDPADMQDILGQINSIRKIHEKLHECGECAQISIKPYLTDLLDNVFSSMTAMKINLSCDIKNIRLSSQKAMLVGLIVNELALNAIKHGFTGSSSEFFVGLERKNGKCRLVVRNTGKSFPPGTGIENPETMGLQLVKAMSEQLGGTVMLEKTPATKFEFIF